MVPTDRVCDRATAAFHEAGHAVLAWRLGHQPAAILVERERGPNARDWGEWSGRLVGVASSIPAEDRTIIALAGPLAEAKYLAQLANADAAFADGPWKDALVRSLLSWAEGNRRLQSEFSADGKTSAIEADFLADDIYHTHASQNTELALRSALERVIHELDDPETWGKVREVGSALAGQEPSSVERVEWDIEILEQFLPR